MIAQKLVRADPEDPNRCIAVGNNGRCPFLRAEPSDKCMRHFAIGDIRKQKQEEVRNYHLTKWKQRINDFADNPKVKSLREEIGILRMVLENVIEKCQDSNDILMFSNKISDLCLNIEKVVASCHRLESSTGQLLDRSAAMNFAIQIINIVGEHVKDADAVTEVSNGIMNALGSLKTEAQEAISG